MRIATVPYDHPDVAVLVEQVQRLYVQRYGEQDMTPVQPAEFAAPSGLFLLGTEDAGHAVACGGWRAHETAARGLRAGDAELKRMYVIPAARGRGYARTLLAELERTAASAGHSRVVLETGLAQPEAMALYASSGYHRIERFGYYRCEPDSVCYAKELS